MPSFDIVCEVDLVEVRNAVDNANRELSTRFDFRNIDASFELDDGNVLLSAEADFQVRQLMDMFRSQCAKRNIDARSLDPQSMSHSGKTVKQIIKMKQGIDQATAKSLIKLIKEAKLKVQASIQGEQVRVTGKKRDDLQATIQLIKDADLGQPFQYQNFRD